MSEFSDLHSEILICFCNVEFLKNYSNISSWLDISVVYGKYLHVRLSQLNNNFLCMSTFALLLSTRSSRIS